MTALVGALTAIPGFETTAYRWLHGRIVWAGDEASADPANDHAIDTGTANGTTAAAAAAADHPRHARRPWQAPAATYCAGRLRAAAQRLQALIAAPPQRLATGLLPWLGGGTLPFPLNLATARFDAVREALIRNDIVQFEAAALRVLGLGPGLTPSGDDFIGAVFFALAHAPRRAWAEALPALTLRIHQAAHAPHQAATNIISAALLDDLMAGRSHRALHVLLTALHDTDTDNDNDNDSDAMLAAAQALLHIGASSGADMLAGLLLALCSAPDDLTET